MEEYVFTPVLGSYEAQVLMRKWTRDMVQPFISLLPTVLVNAVFPLRKVSLRRHEHSRRCPMTRMKWADTLLRLLGHCFLVAYRRWACAVRKLVSIRKCGNRVLV